MTPERELALLLDAANWLRSAPPQLRPGSTISALCERFGLSHEQAMFARRYADDFESKEAANDNGA
ncbi:MAG: hypothetical protein EOS65_10950 [Mesorhizobium sp.]|uniref:hypothetical protein n=1 Tax=Mesorhizobium sp. TaxID=1871066 RepID=UPI000FE55EE7|nr:hypothetical protein [Mesorhizobium sp.]RWF41853.1 MAG: hypothetical protein EOS65_10950 [Mesorhizobium sp.]